MLVLAGAATFVERSEAAARLFREGRAPRVILTNDGDRGPWSPVEQRNPLNVENAAHLLRLRGVPARRITVLPPVVSGTHDEAVLLRDYARRNDLRSLLVVTSAYHSRRARWTLERVFAGTGIEVHVATVPSGVQTPRPAFWWLFPSGWSMVAAEYPKLLFYRLRYG